MPDEFNMGRRKTDDTSRSMRRVLALLDYFIHPSLSQTTEDLYRARVLVGIVLSFSLIVSSAAVLLIAADILANLAVGLAILLSLNAVYIVILWQLRRLGGYLPACHIMIASTMLSVVIGVVISGGPNHSPAMPLNVVPIILAFVLAGKRVGLFWTQWVLSLHGLLFLASFVFDFPQLLSQDKFELFHLMHWAIGYCSIISLMLIFDTINKRLKNERDAERERYRYLASHDPLTDLANRAYFEQHLQQVISERLGQGGNVLVLMIDLDGFKPVNDSLGHEAGDQVLCEISARFKQALRKSDLIARVGGDEFVLVATDVDDEALVAYLADKVLALVREPIAGIPDYLNLSASIGAAWFPKHSQDAKQLMRCADSAMYQAKQSKDHWLMYQAESMDKDAK